MANWISEIKSIQLTPKLIPHIIDQNLVHLFGSNSTTTSSTNNKFTGNWGGGGGGRGEEGSTESRV